jgi:SAM-dependent methyltransferase
MRSKLIKGLHASLEFYKRYLKQHCLGQKVLDYGCGSGYIALEIAQAGAESVIGIDLSNSRLEHAIKQAKKTQLKNVEYLVMNCQKMEFVDNSFDLIGGSSILHHLDLTKACMEIIRVLKVEGRAIFLEPLGHNFFINMFRKFTPDMRDPNEHPLLINDIELLNNFFGEVDTHFFHLTSLIAIPFQRFSFFQTLLLKLELLDRRIFQYFPFFQKYGWVVVIIVSRPKK